MLSTFALILLDLYLNFRALSAPSQIFGNPYLLGATMCLNFSMSSLAFGPPLSLLLNCKGSCFTYKHFTATTVHTHKYTMAGGHIMPSDFSKLSKFSDHPKAVFLLSAALCVVVVWRPPTASPTDHSYRQTYAYVRLTIYNSNNSTLLYVMCLLLLLLPLLLLLCRIGVYEKYVPQISVYKSGLLFAI